MTCFPPCPRQFLADEQDTDRDISGGQYDEAYRFPSPEWLSLGLRGWHAIRSASTLSQERSRHDRDTSQDVVWVSLPSVPDTAGDRRIAAGEAPRPCP